MANTALHERLEKIGNESRAGLGEVSQSIATFSSAIIQGVAALTQTVQGGLGGISTEIQASSTSSDQRLDRIAEAIENLLVRRNDQRRRHILLIGHLLGAIRHTYEKGCRPLNDFAVNLRRSSDYSSVLQAVTEANLSQSAFDECLREVKDPKELRGRRREIESLLESVISVYRSQL